MSYGRTLADVVLDAPRAAALQALATLREFAVSGDVGAVGALGLTLARPLQPVDTPEEAYLEAASFDAFIADERLPPLIRVYASLHRHALCSQTWRGCMSSRWP